MNALRALFAFALLVAAHGEPQPKQDVRSRVAFDKCDECMHSDVFLFQVTFETVRGCDYGSSYTVPFHSALERSLTFGLFDS